MNFILVLILGVVGGIARAMFGESMTATLAVNFIGTFGLGLLTGVTAFRSLRPWLQDGISAGLLGSFTTFSSFATGVVTMGGTHAWLACLYGIGTIIGGLGLAYVGTRISGSLYGLASRSIRRRQAIHQTKT